MKTVFVINPCAGRKKNIQKLIDSIKNISQQFNFDTEIYITKKVGDAEDFVNKYCKNNGVARFIACGGDGTFGEVLNGMINYEGTEIGVIPLGTGNDFCRNFKCRESFMDILSQAKGKSIKCDAILYRTTLANKTKERFCANMFNIGFDCNVADLTATMKKKPLISGSMAYFLSIFAILMKKKGANLAIELDGIKKHSGPLLLTSIANGSYCGGGIKSNPLASLHDGLMDVNIIYNISRLSFLHKLPFYMKGTHIKLKNIENVIFASKCKKISITPLNGAMRLCVDGEIYDAEKTDFELIHNAFNFVVPYNI